MQNFTIEYERPFTYDYQAQILDSLERYTITEASTKVGKTASHIIWLFEQSIGIKNYAAKQIVELPEGANFWWVAPVFGQAEIAFNRMRRQVTDKSFFKVNESKLRLTTPKGTIISFKSADNPDSLYGDDVYASVFDEFTRAKEAAWHALRSTLTATKGSCKFIGNVKGKGNWGYKLAQKAKNGEKGFEHFKLTAYDAVRVGLLDIEEVEAAQRELPEAVFKELYLAEAADNGTNPFGEAHIKQCTYPLSTLPPVCYGIDLAKSHDWTVIIGLDVNGNVCYVDRFQKDWRQTKETIMALGKSMPMQIDSSGVGDPILEDLVHGGMFMVEGYKFTQNSKQQLMTGLCTAIQQRLMTFPEGVITDELGNFEYHYGQHGVQYSAPAGFHDDAVMALALARYCYLTNGKPRSGKYLFV